MADNSHGRRSWTVFIFCCLLAGGVGWLVDAANVPQPLWKSKGSYASIESPLLYRHPWLITWLPEQKQFNVWDLSSSKKEPIRSTSFVSGERRLEDFGNELIDDEFYFLDQQESKVGRTTHLKKWNILTGRLSTVCSRTSSSGRSHVALSVDGSRMFYTTEMPIGHLSLLAPQSMGSVVSAGFVEWSNKKDSTCYLHPHRVEVIDSRNGQTISQFIIPALNAPITQRQLSSDGKWLACAAKVPSFWCQAWKVLGFATLQREIVIYNTQQGGIASKVPYGKQFPLPMKWVGNYLTFGKPIQAHYHGGGIQSVFDGTSGTVLVEPVNGEILHEFSNEDSILSSYCAKDKLVLIICGKVLEIEVRAGLSQKDAFLSRRVYDHALLKPVNYQMQLVPGTTQLAMYRHAQANSRWPRLMSLLYSLNLSDWGRYLPEYHSVDVYDYTTGQQKELIRSTSRDQDVSLSSNPANLVSVMKLGDTPEIHLWSSAIPLWNTGWSIVTALLVLMGLLWWTRRRRTALGSLRYGVPSRRG